MQRRGPAFNVDLDTLEDRCARQRLLDSHALAHTKWSLVVQRPLSESSQASNPYFSILGADFQVVLEKDQYGTCQKCCHKISRESCKPDSEIVRDALGTLVPFRAKRVMQSCCQLLVAISAIVRH